MQWNENHKWTMEARLPKVQEFEFKVVAVLGHTVRWEQGVNRVVQADEDGLDVPVELVINLVCSFDLTLSTSMELVLDRHSVQESYELATATLELLQKRRARLVRTLQETTTQGPAVAEQQAEAARLDAAVSNQARSIEELGQLVSSAVMSEDGQTLLLPLSGNKVEVPKEVTSLSKAHAAIALALGDSGAVAAAAALPAPSPNTTIEAAGPLDDGLHPLDPLDAGVDDTSAEMEADKIEASWSALSANGNFSDSDQSDLEPDDAAAAMAAAAFAELATTKSRKSKKRKVRRASAPEVAAVDPLPVLARSVSPHATPSDAVAAAIAASISVSPTTTAVLTQAAQVAAAAAAAGPAAQMVDVVAGAAPGPIQPVIAAAAPAPAQPADVSAAPAASTVRSSSPPAATAPMDTASDTSGGSPAVADRRSRSSSPLPLSEEDRIKLAGLPMPKPEGNDGALFFSADLLSAVKLPPPPPPFPSPKSASPRRYSSPPPMERRLSAFTFTFSKKGTTTVTPRTFDTDQPSPSSPTPASPASEANGTHAAADHAVSSQHANGATSASTNCSASGDGATPSRPSTKDGQQLNSSDKRLMAEWRKAEARVTDAEELVK